MPIDKPWLPRERFAPKALPGTVGVYELGDAGGDVIFVGFAGGRTAFGLRGVIGDHFSDNEPNTVIRARAERYRYEVTTNYLIRRLELLSRFHEDNGRLPPGNEAGREPLPPLARYHWTTPTSRGV